MQKIEEFTELYLQRKALKEQVSKLDDKIAIRMHGLIEHMVDEGVEKVSMTGGRTLDIRSEIWPKYGNKENAIKALKAAGIKDMIQEGFNHQRLAAFIRERIRADDKLPQEFEGLIRAETVQKLVARKL
jgi:hypothetical protein